MIAETYRSTPAFTPGGVAPIFECIGCGDDVVGYHFLQVRGICPRCCTDHDLEYSPEQRMHTCKHCDEPASDDWYDNDDH